jgi:hypothetical protein
MVSVSSKIARLVRYVIGLLTAMSLCGCVDSGIRSWTVIPLAQNCQVLMLSPPTARNKAPVRVSIFWDDHLIFDNNLPQYDGTSNPRDLVRMWAVPGVYSLKVTHDGASKEIKIRLKEGSTRFFMIFGTGKSEDGFIKDYGDEQPMFL